MRRLLTAALLLVVLAGAASAPARTPRIVGGSPADGGEFPWVAGLKIAIDSDQPNALCAGSLIAARWVLTAGHCLAEGTVDTAHSVAILGTTNLETARPAQEYGWKSILVDPDYLTGGGGSDVGLIELDRPAPLRQLRLLRPSETVLWAPEQTAIVAGWGFTEDPDDGGFLSTNQLNQVALRIYSDNDCRAAFDKAGGSDSLDFATELCALAPGKDACNGDSGGPLMVADPTTGSFALAGAVSFGIGNGGLLGGNRSCNEGPPGVYSRLGADPLNAFVRAHVPQVEIDYRPRMPAAGQPVRLTARATAPGEPGRFGGYDYLSWDLNGDGRFGQAGGQVHVLHAMRPGVRVVGVRATSADGDNETRTVRILVGPNVPLGPVRRTGALAGRYLR
ncbi:MAG: hypothetical protein QOF76_1338 [Solirubrobacteraceae bacterium]|nr:hypothetical protein [Solirubrobacteraceae bacterium]